MEFFYLQLIDIDTSKKKQSDGNNLAKFDEATIRFDKTMIGIGKTTYRVDSRSAPQNLRQSSVLTSRSTAAETFVAISAHIFFFAGMSKYCWCVNWYMAGYWRIAAHKATFTSYSLDFFDCFVAEVFGRDFFDFDGGDFGDLDGDLATRFDWALAVFSVRSSSSILISMSTTMKMKMAMAMGSLVISTVMLAFWLFSSLLATTLFWPLLDLC